MIRVSIPFHLRTLAGLGGEGDALVEVAGPVTIAAVLEALERKHPMLRGTIRDHGTRERRPFIRFFAGGKDPSHDPPDETPLPEAVAAGREPLLVVGAIAGG